MAIDQSEALGYALEDGAECLPDILADLYADAEDILDDSADIFLMLDKKTDPVLDSVTDCLSSVGQFFR